MTTNELCLVENMKGYIFERSAESLKRQVASKSKVYSG